MGNNPNRHYTKFSDILIKRTSSAQIASFGLTGQEADIEIPLTDETEEQIYHKLELEIGSLITDDKLLNKILSAVDSYCCKLGNYHFELGIKFMARMIFNLLN